jgi:putative RNA 2'-phosphotransferase
MPRPDPKKPLTQRQTSRLSHHMSKILRHKAGALGLPMDAAGWMQLEDLERHISATRAHIGQAVEGNNKDRYELLDGRIRASQGHSLEGMPITCEALEASWQSFDGQGSVWHGTNVVAAHGIAKAGIQAGARSHVHLAVAPDSKVGKRANVALLLEVGVERLRAAGQALFVSSNGVVLAREVPVDCIVGWRELVDDSDAENMRYLAELLGPPSVG